jgi:hypothetical protein
MPPTPSAFSYDQDVQPYASKYFDRVSSDKNLSHGAKMRLQGTLLDGLEGIEAQRAKLAEERDKGQARKLSYASGVFDLENARASRARAEQMETRRAGVSDIARGIIDSDDDPETKRQMLARTALEYAEDRDAREVFQMAERALPKQADSLLSDSATMAMILDGVPQEEIALAKETRDYSRIGAISRKLKVEHDTAVENKRVGAAEDKEARSIKLGLAKSPLKFAKGDLSGEESDWLEDDSTSLATAIVQTLGDDKGVDLQRFLALKGASSDRERASHVRDIQLRYLQNASQERGGTEEKGAAPLNRGQRVVWQKKAK